MPTIALSDGTSVTVSNKAASGSDFFKAALEMGGATIAFPPPEATFASEAVAIVKLALECLEQSGCASLSELTFGEWGRVVRLLNFLGAPNCLLHAFQVDIKKNYPNYTWFGAPEAKYARLTAKEYLDVVEMLPVNCHLSKTVEGVRDTVKPEVRSQRWHLFRF